MTYFTHDVPVRGGVMRVGEWRPECPDAPTIVALHGMSGSHLAWQFLAEQLPEYRIVAPDLRGRGLSAQLPAPFGVASHLDDVAAISAALNVSRATIVGHSMGAFVAVAALREHPEVFVRGILADGGLPVTVPLDLADDELVEAVLGVAAARRVEFTFSSRDMYRKFWRLHPAFAGDWSEALSSYADYDLAEVVTTDGEVAFRPVANPAAVKADARELYGSHALRATLCGLRVPMTVLYASRGLLNETPGVYSGREIAGWQAELPSTVSFVEVAEANHYTLVLSQHGAEAIAQVLRTALVPS
ncbi:alpha/beta fold hydrolase [Subtercola frigoramans]|uniref:Pimeloyl-ACP methyl ester carboxylesterase n=1 Tax=Subtercola frigoramans TaxID=120298 RepID=A0ABS2L4N1_9MICO|nr:alpha/beta hydrolase [Subtercola frigoramans]MBM7472050.1 pimeloyl-ACP methyl ester carboxylesterase [Subtercola frigoramans]